MSTNIAIYEQSSNSMWIMLQETEANFNLGLDNHRKDLNIHPCQSLLHKTQIIVQLHTKLTLIMKPTG